MRQSRWELRHQLRRHRPEPEEIQVKTEEVGDDNARVLFIFLCSLSSRAVGEHVIPDRPKEMPRLVSFSLIIRLVSELPKFELCLV